jgi:hypothetical protein
METARTTGQRRRKHCRHGFPRFGIFYNELGRDTCIGLVGKRAGSVTWKNFTTGYFYFYKFSCG